jgi:8-oxo-dGTP pyrophosphatase MutT (NUDIX family)
MAVVPRNASTVVLLRSRNGLEVLMLRRHGRSAFFPGAYVFPGGAVEGGDWDPGVEELCHGLSFDEAHKTISAVTPRELSLGFFVAAIRETFEEAGILLAYDGPDEKLVSTDKRKTEIAATRRKVHQDPGVFLRMIRESRMRLATDRLFYFAHWITPEISPIRFDARFFLAETPLDQEVSHDALETTDAMWRSPVEILRDHNEKRLYLPVPTLSSLKVLASFPTVEEAIESTRGKEIQVCHG